MAHRTTSRPRRMFPTVLAVLMAVTAPLQHTSAAPLSAPGLQFGGFDPPLAGPVDVTTGYAAPEQRWNRGHRGVDLRGTRLAPVLAPASGHVSFVGMVAGRPVLSVMHGRGLRTTYEPVTAVLAQGQQVTRGQVIGHLLAGHPGCLAEACLHWGARVDTGGESADDDYIDPLSLLTGDLRPIRLKPLLAGDGDG